MNDDTKTFTSPSIFGLLADHGISWMIYGYDSPPLTRQTFTDITDQDDAQFGLLLISRRRPPRVHWPLLLSWSPVGNRRAIASTRTMT